MRSRTRAEQRVVAAIIATAIPIAAAALVYVGAAVSATKLALVA